MGDERTRLCYRIDTPSNKLFQYVPGLRPSTGYPFRCATRAPLNNGVGRKSSEDKLIHMTIAAAWIRTLANGAEELLLCSDSRLSNGKRFDHGQKTFRFSRTDAAICFAGGTDWAYPMIVAAINATSIHLPSQTRALGLSKFKSHLVSILNQMQKEVHNFVDGEEIPTVTFVFGGYDWWKKRFRIWRIEFDKEASAFFSTERKGSNKFGGLGRIEIAGDLEWETEFRERLKTLAQQRHGLDLGKSKGVRFDLEPFEVIRELLMESNANDSIGGAPQIVKVYQFQNSADVGIFWPKFPDGRLFLCGRPLLEYERATIKSVLDPETLNSTWSSGSPAEAANQLKIACESDAARISDDDPEAEEIPDQ